MICAGIDAGSRAIKIVLLKSDNNQLLGSGITDQSVNQKTLIAGLFKKVLSQAGISRKAVKKIVATGYGRNSIDFADTTITEITCHARGVHHSNPSARTIIDIGGEDSKLIRIVPNGDVRDFMINDRCAAGTGRFLEVVAKRLGVELNDLGKLAIRADTPSSISSMCVVFAETEIIGLLAAGETPENIIAGVQKSIASRISSMAGRRIDDPVIFTGGVALVPQMNKALETALGHDVKTAKDPQFTGAFGAAILASET